MTQESTVNSVLRDLKFKNIINEKDSSYVQLMLEGVWTSGWECQRAEDTKNRQGTSRKVVYYGREDQTLATFKSIEEASNELTIPRKTICHSLYRQTSRMRNGHYFRYAENGEGDNHDSIG